MKAQRTQDYPLPDNEEERLREIVKYDFSGEGVQASLDEICRLAQSLFEVPVALITVVGRDDQTFLAKCGVSAAGTSRKDAFCTYAILQDDVFVVSDATQDIRFVDNPLVTGEMGIRFYAGAPLSVRPGIRIGTLCLIDTKPHAFSEDDAARLKMIAKVAVNELRRHRLMLDGERQRETISQAARLAHVGSWSLELPAETLAWSAETYSIFEVDPSVTPTREMVKTFWDKRDSWLIANSMERLIREGASLDQELSIVTARGSRRWIRCIAEAEFANGEVTRLTGSVQDITAQHEHAAEVERLAFRDSLTGLPNRALFQRRLASAMTDAQVWGSKVGLLMLDIDHFKDVNDTLGHDAGDALLQLVSRQLLEVFGSSDTVARLSGDEFAIIIPGVSHPDEITTPTERLLERLRHPHAHDGKSLSVTASVGASMFPDDAGDGAQLLKCADIALYRAKSEGRNRLAVFDHAMRQEVEDRIASLHNIRAGLASDQFVLYFQPLVEVAGPNAVTGFEALMRWDHPTRGVLTPDKFLIGFEDQELSLALGEVALDGAMSQMRAWLDDGIEFGRIAVNLSGSQFRRGGLVESILGKLERWGVPADRLTLEVTENVYMGWASDVVADTIRALHSTGILIALDDFGTGYASLTNLKQFPIDRLKIDRSFIRDLDDPAIVAAVLSLGSNMGMKVVAEGVEDADQVRLLRAMGCDQAQGYFFGRPMPAKEVPEFLRLAALGQLTLSQAAA